MAVDLFTLNNKDYLVTVDYFSNFIEVDRLSTTKSRSVIKELKQQFARHEIADILITDSCSQFLSEEIKEFSTHG